MGIYAARRQAFAIEGTVIVRPDLADEAYRHIQAGHRPYRVAGRTTRHFSGLHRSKQPVHFQQSFIVYKGDASLLQLQVCQYLVALHDGKYIGQSIAQSNYFIHFRYFFCKDIAYFKISYYFCTAFKEKQHSSLAQSVRASDC